jgi:hypothetical protein
MKKAIQNKLTLATRVICRCPFEWSQYYGHWLAIGQVSDSKWTIPGGEV